MFTCNIHVLNAVFLALTIFQARGEEEDHQTEVERLHAFIASDAYNNKIRPEAFHDKPNVVYLDFVVVRLSSFEEAAMVYGLSMYLRQKWKDFRLANPNRTRTVAMSFSMYDKLWVPDTYIVNEEHATFHTTTVPNRLLRVDSYGWILYSQKVTARLGCEYRLKKFPHDSQVCSLEIESVGHTTDDIQLEWKLTQPPLGNMMIKIPQFTITGYKIGDCTKTYYTGRFSCLKVDFFFQRGLSYYILRVFLPSLLAVLLSWLSFWICHRATAARISIGILSLLSIVTQQSDLGKELAAVSYLTAYDLWMAVCLVFVFASVIEYSLISVLDRNYRRAVKRQKKKELQSALKRKKCASSKPKASPESKRVIFRQPEASMVSLPKYIPDLATQVDHVARYLFPGLFLLFNVVYWTSYYSISDN